jgi:hypothetical protein
MEGVFEEHIRHMEHNVAHVLNVPVHTFRHSTAHLPMGMCRMCLMCRCAFSAHGLSVSGILRSNIGVRAGTVGLFKMIGEDLVESKHERVRCQSHPRDRCGPEPRALLHAGRKPREQRHEWTARCWPRRSLSILVACRTKPALPLRSSQMTLLAAGARRALSAEFFWRILQP